MAEEKTLSKDEIKQYIDSVVGDKPFIKHGDSVIHKVRWVTKDQLMICPQCGSNAERVDNRFVCRAGCESEWSLSPGDIPQKLESKKK